MRPRLRMSSGFMRPLRHALGVAAQARVPVHAARQILLRDVSTVARRKGVLVEALLVAKLRLLAISKVVERKGPESVSDEAPTTAHPFSGARGARCLLFTLWTFISAQLRRQQVQVSNSNGWPI